MLDENDVHGAGRMYEDEPYNHGAGGQDFVFDPSLFNWDACGRFFDA